MKSDLFSKVPCAKLWNDRKVYYKGRFCAKNTLLYWNESWQGEEDASNVQLCVVTRVLCSSQLPGKGDMLCLRAGHSVWIGIFPAVAAYWGPDLPLPNLVPARISPDFSTHAGNTMQVSFSALTCKECQLLRTGIFFWFSLCTGPGTAGSWLIILVPVSTSTVWRIIFKNVIQMQADLQNGFEVNQVYTRISPNIW